MPQGSGRLHSLCVIRDLEAGTATKVGSQSVEQCEKTYYISERSLHAAPAVDAICCIQRYPDAARLREQAVNKHVGDVVLLQLSQADLIMLNKTDGVTAKDLAEVRKGLGERAPGIPVCETVRSNAPNDLLLGRGSTPRPKQPLPFPGQPLNRKKRHRTWIIRHDRPVARAAIGRLAGLMGPRIFRAKGFVQPSEAPARRHLLQQVGRRWTLEDIGGWESATPKTAIFCIGVPEKADELTKTLQAVLSPVMKNCTAIDSVNRPITLIINAPCVPCRSTKGFSKARLQHALLDTIRVARSL